MFYAYWDIYCSQICRRTRHFPARLHAAKLAKLHPGPGRELHLGLVHRPSVWRASTISSSEGSHDRGREDNAVEARLLAWPEYFPRLSPLSGERLTGLWTDARRQLAIRRPGKDMAGALNSSPLTWHGNRHP